MTTLHEVRLANVTAVVWAYPVGGNGAYLSATRVARWSPLFHAYPATRGTPPVGDQGWMRQNWHPWGGNWDNPNWGADPLTPLCGRINSRSRMATLRAAGDGYREDRYCAECRRRAPNATFINILHARDPWNNIGYRERAYTLDPITGL